MGQNVERVEAWLDHPIGATGTWTAATQEQFTTQTTLVDPFHDGRRSGFLMNLTGAIWEKGLSHSWSAAKDHAYDDLWATAIASMKANWPSQLYVALAHAFNVSDDSIHWKVSGGEENDFTEAWAIFADMFRSQLPDAKLVWCPKAGGSTPLSNAFPDPSKVDAVGIIAETAGYDTFEEMWQQPNGLRVAQELAVANGLPLVVCSWSIQKEQDQLAREFVNWLLDNAGTGPGEVELAVYDDGVPDCTEQEESADYAEWESTCRALREAISDGLQ